MRAQHLLLRATVYWYAQSVVQPEGMRANLPIKDNASLQCDSLVSSAFMVIWKMAHHHTSVIAYLAAYQQYCRLLSHSRRIQERQLYDLIAPLRMDIVIHEYFFFCFVLSKPYGFMLDLSTRTAGVRASRHSMTTAVTVRGMSCVSVR